MFPKIILKNKAFFFLLCCIFGNVCGIPEFCNNIFNFENKNIKTFKHMTYDTTCHKEAKGERRRWSY